MPHVFCSAFCFEIKDQVGKYLSIMPVVYFSPAYNENNIAAQMVYSHNGEWAIKDHRLVNRIALLPNF